MSTFSTRSFNNFLTQQKSEDTTWIPYNRNLASVFLMLLGSHTLQSYTVGLTLEMGKSYWHSLLSSSDMYQRSTPRKQIQTWNLSMQWVRRTKAKRGWRLPGEEGSPKVKPQKQARTRQVLMMVFVWSLISVMPTVKYFCVWMVIVIVTVFRQNPTISLRLVLNSGFLLPPPECWDYRPMCWMQRVKACATTMPGLKPNLL